MSWEGFRKNQRQGDGGNQATSSGQPNTGDPPSQSSPAQASASGTAQTTSQGSQGATSAPASSWANVAARPSSSSAIPSTAATPNLPAPSALRPKPAAPTFVPGLSTSVSNAAAPSTVVSNTPAPSTATSNTATSNIAISNTATSNTATSNTATSNTTPSSTASSNTAVPNPVASNAGASNTTATTIPYVVPNASTSAPSQDTRYNATLQEVGIQRSTAQLSWGSTRLMHEFGLRTEHGNRQDTPPGQRASTAQNAQNRSVFANYVRIQAVPQTVYVYKLTFVRVTVNNQETKLKNKIEKKAIFNSLKTRQGFTSLASQHCVTDHDLIWSTKELFPQATLQPNPLTAANFVVNHPHTGQPITFERVRVSWDRQINTRQNVRRLTASNNAATTDADDAAILVRGINAFMTQHARDQQNTQGYASTSANKFFLTEGPHVRHLDAPARATLRAFRGFSLSARPGVSDLFLNIHVGASPFLEETSVQNLFSRLQSMGITTREAFNAFRGKEAVVHGPQNSRTNVIITEIASSGIRDTGRTWNQLNQELIRLGYNTDFSNMAVNVGTTQNRVTHHASRVTLHGFHAFRGLMSGSQTSSMLSFACKLPTYNKNYLERDGFRLFGINTPNGQQKAQSYGMTTERSLLRVPARWLAPPQLIYHGNMSAAGFQEASWNLQDRSFFAACNLTQIRILDLHLIHNWRSNAPNVGGVAQGLQAELRRLGMHGVQVVADPSPQAQNPNMPDEKKVLQWFINLPGGLSAPVFVILPQHNCDLYANIKRVSDLHLGRHAVCGSSEKMKGYNANRGTQYFANVGMKFNLKGVGTNHAVEGAHLNAILDDPLRPLGDQCDTIIVGADVAHPTGSARPGCPSIAAVVGSTDDSFLHYPGSMRLQISRQEHIEELRYMVKERLIDWGNNHQRRLPAKMLFYRDGVSESQYNDVRQHEMPQLLDAYSDAYKFFNNNQDLPASPNPPFRLTFVVVGKRHNTRFFTDNTCQQNTFISDLGKKEQEDRIWPGLQREEGQAFQEKRNGRGEVTGWTRVNHNILPGFVVDDVITHPYSNDFFLQSHKPLQGTGRSAHYFVLQNQMGLDADDLQRVTHALCYIYARATKGVSYCAPAYYADRLCDRGRAWLREWLTGRNIPMTQNTNATPAESWDQFKLRVLRAVDSGPCWRPRNHGNYPRDPQQYGGPRRNPWHPNLDGVMFYL